VIVFGLIVGLGFASGIPGATARAGLGHGGVATAPHPFVAPAVVHPAQPATEVSLQLITGLGTYTALPTNLILNLTVNNSGIDTVSPNTWLWVNVTDYVTNTYCGSNNVSSMVTPAGPMTGSTFATEYITFALTSAFFTGDSAACPGIANDTALLNMTATVTDPTNGTGVATGYQLGVCNVFVFGWCVPTVSAFVFTPPTSLLHVTPVSGATYTFSIYADYTGQYVGKVLLSVYNPTGTSVILSKNLRWNGTTPTTYTWIQTTPAVYPYTLSVNTAYGVYNSTGSIVVSPATYVYTNETSWTNSTLIPGLSSGGAGTLLLVVGLIIGMIVALIVGRRVWAGPKPAPAQPWTPKTGAANECSVCGRSFATPEELAEHSKSEHGMQ